MCCASLCTTLTVKRMYFRHKVLKLYLPSHKMRRTELFTRLGSNNPTLHTSWITIAFTKCTNITGKIIEVTSFLLNSIRWCNHCIYKYTVVISPNVFVYFGMYHIFKTFVSYSSKCFIVTLTCIHKLWNVRTFKIEWVLES